MGGFAVLTGPGGPEGYLKHVRVISFNAWHYAETNLWASLVDQVIRKIEPEPTAPAVPEVTEADRLADQAEDECRQAAGKLAQARCDTEEAKKRFIRQRHTAWALGIGLLLLAGAVVLLAALGESARVVAVASLAAAVLGSLAAAVAQFTRVRGQATEIIDAGRAGLGVLSRVSGRAEGMAAQAAVLNERKLAAEQEAAAANAVQLRAAADQARTRAKADVVGTVLGYLSSVTEYREQLSLVARTRERFDDVGGRPARGHHPAHRQAVREHVPAPEGAGRRTRRVRPPPGQHRRPRGRRLPAGRRHQPPRGLPAPAARPHLRAGRQTLQPVVAALATAPVPLAPARAGAGDPPLADVLSWLDRYPRYANAPAHRYTKWPWKSPGSPSAPPPATSSAPPRPPR